MNAPRWKAGPAGLRMKNAVADFPKRELEHEGIICARLGQDRDKPSSFSYSDGRISVAAHVRKGRARSQCQDAAMVFIAGSHVYLGVFDGFGPSGTVLSEYTADSLITSLASKEKPHSLFEYVVRRVCDSTSPGAPLDRGGTTAAFASISLENDGCSIQGVADAAAYRLRRDGNMARLMPGYQLNCEGFPIAGMQPEFHFQNRNIVSGTISYGCEAKLKFNCDGALIDPGDGVILVTDGVTKNLSVSIDPATRMISENSGCRDLSRILKGCSTASGIVSAILKAIDKRLDFKEQNGKPPKAGKNEALEPDGDDVAIVAFIRGA